MQKSLPLPPSVKRYRAFKKALIDEDVTVTIFARELGISRVHLIRSFRAPYAEGVAQRIHDAIDALIEKHAQEAVAA